MVQTPETIFLAYFVQNEHLSTGNIDPNTLFMMIMKSHISKGF